MYVKSSLQRIGHVAETVVPDKLLCEYFESDECNAYKRPELKLNRLSMKISNKLFNGDHIDVVMVNVTQRRL